MKASMRVLLGVAMVGSIGAIYGCADSGNGTTLSTSSGGHTGGANAGNSTGAFAQGSGSESSGTPCTGLQCQIHSCSGGAHTTITGKIYDPAGKNPLYGVVAYVPNSPPQPFT